MKNLLYDLYFCPWYYERLSADQRWILEKDENFSHAKKVCEKETNEQEFHWWNDHARSLAGIDIGEVKPMNDASIHNEA